MIRITPTFFLNQTIRTVQTHFGRIAELQEQAATGRKVRRPSDGPAQLALARFLSGDIGRIEAHLANLQEAKTTLQLSVDTLREASNLVREARQVALQANSSTLDEAQYTVLAKKVETILGRLIDVANTSVRGRYLFSGTALDVAPFEVTYGPDGRVEEVVYVGSSRPVEFVIGLSRTVVGHPPGEAIFMSRTGGTPIFRGDTGAAPGEGTSTVRSRVQLEVRHTVTTYGGGAGVQPGASSPAGDTIIGAPGVHTLTVEDTSGTGTSGTVSLNGGPPVPFTNGDTDLRVEGPNGEVVYVDMSNITPGFSGTIPITADGEMTIDGGATVVPIDFTSNQVVVHGGTGERLYVDTSGVSRTGVEVVDVEGRFDVFSLLRTMADDLRNAPNLTSDELASRIDTFVRELDRHYNKILETVGQEGALQQLVERAIARSESTKVELERLRQEAQDADISEIVLRLRAEESTLQLTLAASARLLNISLLDFLR